MVLTRFKIGSVYFRNSRMKGLSPQFSSDHSKAVSLCLVIVSSSSPFLFGALGKLYFVIVAIPGSFHLYFRIVIMRFEGELHIT